MQYRWHDQPNAGRSDGMTDIGSPDRSGRAVTLAVGFAPVVLLLTTMGQSLSALQFILKTLAVPVLLAEIAVALWLIPRGRVLRPPSWVAICLAGLLLIAVVTSATAGDRVVSLVKTAVWIVHLTFGVALYAACKDGRISANHLCRDMAVGFALFTGILILYAAAHREADHDWIFRFPGYSNVRSYGYYAAGIAGLCLWGWCRGEKASGAIATLALGAAFWTGSRGTAVAVVGGYAAALLLFPFTKKAFPRLLLALAAAVLMSFALTALLPLGELGPQRLAGDYGDNGRIAIWSRTLEVALQRPWFGWGESQFAALFPATGLAQPHNIILQILLSWGLVGMGLVAILAVWLGCRIYRATDEHNAGFLLAALSIAVFSLFDGSLYHVQSASIFAQCIAVLLATTVEEARAVQKR